VLAPTGDEKSIARVLLTHQREGHWSAGYEVSDTPIEFSDSGAVAGNFAGINEAIVSGCTRMLGAIESKRQESVGKPRSDKRFIQLHRLATAVRKLRKSYEGKSPTSAKCKLQNPNCKIKAPRATPHCPSTALVPAAAETPLPAAGQETLDAAERRDLKRLEAQIERNRQAIVDWGNALREIRDRRLYRATHPTFDAYLLERWGFDRREASDRILAAETATTLSPISDRLKLPLVESHLRELQGLEADDQKAIYEEAAHRAQKDHQPLTAKLIRQVKRADQQTQDQPDGRSQEPGVRRPRPRKCRRRPTTRPDHQRPTDH